MVADIGEKDKLEMFENSVFCILFRSMRNDVIEEWIQRNKEELNDLKSPPNILGEMKSRKRDGRRM
jgi:hypothetical protein